ncbi:extensin family protein [Erythrobacter sp. LQ02-29]|uniref:extensin family protein n=1 Tax=Erythrobacter sp. LQ02-29 TaxID=2920384 RepID=UPI001F4D6ADE|nr:extensin family protein [Erythrobacter sp. LQ02-29]MCP9222663.1 extensin family protein [Erythrobacter sp. LQ02-29]
MARGLASIAVLTAALSLPACSLLPGGKGSTPEPARPARDVAQPVAESPANRLCLARLADQGATFSALPDRYFGDGCHTLGTVQLSGLAADVGTVELGNIGPVTCPLASTLEGWARYGVDRAARRHLGAPLARIETFGSYSCRNVAGSSRRSAHSRAEAVDIAAFVLTDGRRISVSGDWNSGDGAKRDFLRIVHASACKRFGTVLGPDYNAAHHDHFHLESGDGSFCR